jgi:hypothetical protein
MADNENRQWSTAPDGNQDEKSLRLGISIDNVAARPLNDMPPGILPASGPLRATPTDHRGGK